MAGIRRVLSSLLPQQNAPVLSQSELAEHGATAQEYEVLASNDEEETPTEPIGIPISALPGADTPTGSDAIPGVQDDETVQYSLADLLAWIIGETTPADIGAVPETRKVNNHALDADVTLTPADVGAVPTSRTVNNKALSADITLTASDVGARPDNWTPSAGDVGAQPTITASGILKGDGSGGVSAAVAGTDYQAPLTAGTDYATPAMVSPKANQAQLAYVESGSTASKNYTIGEYFCWSGELYRATAAISIGASFVAGASGNCVSVKAMDYYSNTWTPINVTVSTGNAPRNRFIRSGGFLAIYFVAALSSDLADVSTLDICSDVAATFGVSDVLTPFVKAAAISTRTSAATGDIIFNLQFNSNKLTLVNRSGVTVPAANRNVFAWILLGI